jgi:hypothetical protein
MKLNTSRIFVFLCLAQSASAALTASVSGSSTLWTPLVGNFDKETDQQTGPPDSDIVGTTADAGMLFIFDDNGTPDDHADGWLGFRVRMDAVNSQDGTKPGSVVVVGIAAGTDGNIDAFVGIDPKAVGQTPKIRIYDSGAGTNVSPSTSSIGGVLYTYDVVSTNFNYRAVNYPGDGGTTNDVTTAASGDIDYYASFLVPFADLAVALGIPIDDRVALRYMSVTAQQPNTLNQDFGGVDGTINGNNSTTTWVEMGAFSNSVSVPEPSSTLSALSSCAAFLLLRRRR